MWLGIDLGTQSIRAVAVTDTGRLLASSSHPLTGCRDGGRHEQAPEDWWRAVQHICRALFARLPGRSVDGVAVDGTSGTILLADQFGAPLTSGLMYDDGRARDEAQVVEASALGAVLECRVQASWALPKLLWLLRQRSQETTENVRLIHQSDFINWYLAGHEVPSDWSNAFKSGYDLAREQWPTTALAQLGVPAQILPAVVRPGTQIGTVCAKASAGTGIPAGTPIFAGMTDGCAAQIAAGALTVGNWNSVLGTTLVLKGVSGRRLHDPNGLVYSHRLPDGTWLPGAASSTGAGVLTKYFSGRDLDRLSAQAAVREPTRLIAYPLAGRGERFPFCAPEAEGFVLGQPADDIAFFASLLQGVGFIERLCFDYMTLLGAPINGDVILTGGATRSRYWNQLRADILGRPLLLPENHEPAFGMAILAASGGRNLAGTARRMVCIREVIEPRKNRSACFRELYLKLVEELARRAWIGPELSALAARRVSASE